VHYRVARTIDASTLTTLRDLVPTKLAASVWNCLARYKSTIPEFPQTETCELLIVDRSIDQVGFIFPANLVYVCATCPMEYSWCIL
jgi:syntaxin-binding protein 1